MTHNGTVPVEGTSGTGRLVVRPITLKEANAEVQRIHRHHDGVQGHRWAQAAFLGDRLVGVAISGNPIARELQDGLTFEVRRLATDGTPNACSFLYGAAWRAAKGIGFLRGLTYILESEPGTSLRAAGWTLGPVVRGGTWSRPSRARVDKHPTVRKVRWQIGDWRWGGA